jgi:hypothetical protein
MTRVIGARARADYGRGVLQEHRTLVSALDISPLTPREVIAVGRSLLAFAGTEGTSLRVLLSLLEPAVRDDLATEHERLADDLALLEWLIESAPGSPDVTTLADSLIRRMREHVSRDGRLLEQAARLGATR